MRSGLLRHRVTIQENLPGRDTFGEEDENWTDVATVWAAIEPLAGQEEYLNTIDQRVATATTRIRLRYRAGLHSEMRVLWGERVYDVRTVLDVLGQRQELHLLCEEKNG